ncbi:O-methyltransferase [Alicyclobacillus fodiniaquatilis]|jgi:predicted O-methyltransferase YrrM|uniref:O-methyltransferase n=1 Tax=Alicyclobacillus fodiniaquatilis TaxID=1661150 RepID=A0ABW4JNK5_9BACL
MDKQVWSVIQAVEQLDKTNDLKEPLYRISSDNALFLHMLVRMSGAKNILEIGSSGGYSGLFLAEAARANGGTLTTCEVSPYKIQLANTFYDRAGLADVVTLVEGDARETVKRLEGPWDFVFIDAWKDDYPQYLELVWPHVKSGGVVAADDIISQARDVGIKEYLQQVRALEDAYTVTVPIDDGVELTYKQ